MNEVMIQKPEENPLCRAEQQEARSVFEFPRSAA